MIFENEYVGRFSKYRITKNIISIYVRTSKEIFVLNDLKQMIILTEIMKKIHNICLILSCLLSIVYIFILKVFNGAIRNEYILYSLF